MNNLHTKNTLRAELHREDSRGNVITLLEPVAAYGFTVPAGFASDGASVPRFFWRLVFPPTDTRAIRAAVIHDYLYRARPAGFTRLDADRIFLRELIAGGVPQTRARMAYLGVRIFGASSWRAPAE